MILMFKNFCYMLQMLHRRIGTYNESGRTEQNLFPFSLSILWYKLIEEVFHLSFTLIQSVGIKTQHLLLLLRALNNHNNNMATSLLVFQGINSDSWWCFHGRIWRRNKGDGGTAQGASGMRFQPRINAGKMKSMVAFWQQSQTLILFKLTQTNWTIMTLHHPFGVLAHCDGFYESLIQTRVWGRRNLTIFFFRRRSLLRIIQESKSHLR